MCELFESYPKLCLEFSKKKNVASRKNFSIFACRKSSLRLVSRSIRGTFLAGECHAGYEVDVRESSHERRRSLEWVQLSHTANLIGSHSRDSQSLYESISSLHITRYNSTPVYVSAFPFSQLNGSISISLCTLYSLALSGTWFSSHRPIRLVQLPIHEWPNGVHSRTCARMLTRPFGQPLFSYYTEFYLCVLSCTSFCAALVTMACTIRRTIRQGHDHRQSV